jgi:hypothetical protein
MARAIALDPEARRLADQLLAKVVPAFIPGLEPMSEDEVEELAHRDDEEDELRPHAELADLLEPDPGDGEPIEEEYDPGDET